MTSFAAEGKLPLTEPLCGYVRQGFVDVHAHIIHEQFAGQEDAIAEACEAAGLDYVVVNGLEPVSNRLVLEYCSKHPTLMLPALGIYPLDAACHAIFTPKDIEEMKIAIESNESFSEDDKAAQLAALPTSNWHHEFAPPKKFDLAAEIAFIEQMAAEKRIVAIGECGLDGHYLTDAASLKAQEDVLRQLMRIGRRYDLPVILHSRKCEQRVFELLQEEQVVKADFHCYGGKVRPISFSMNSFQLRDFYFLFCRRLILPCKLPPRATICPSPQRLLPNIMLLKR